MMNVEIDKGEIKTKEINNMGGTAICKFSMDSSFDIQHGTLISYVLKFYNYFSFIVLQPKEKQLSIHMVFFSFKEKRLEMKPKLHYLGFLMHPSIDYFLQLFPRKSHHHQEQPHPIYPWSNAKPRVP